MQLNEKMKMKKNNNKIKVYIINEEDVQIKTK